MIVLKIIGIVLAVLVGVVALILLLWVDVCVERTEKHGFRLYVRVLGIPFGRKKRKNNKKKSEPKEKNASARLKQLLGLSSAENEEGKGSFAETLGETVETVKELTEHLVWLVRRFRVPRLRVTVAAGGEDAAMEYGLACAVLHPLAVYLQETAGLKERRVRLLLGCDFTREKTLYELALTIRIPLFYAAVAALRYLGRNLTKEQ